MVRPQRTCTSRDHQAHRILRRGLPRILALLLQGRGLALVFFYGRLGEGDGEDGVDQGFPEDAKPAEGRLSGEKVDLQDVVGGYGPVQHRDAEEYVSQVQPDTARAG